MSTAHFRLTATTEAVFSQLERLILNDMKSLQMFVYNDKIFWPILDDPFDFTSQKF